ncbi:MAG: hypothetical protein WDN50_07970 [Bradyrhizobium sp.]
MPSVADGPVSGAWKPILISARAGIAAVLRTKTLAKPRSRFAVRAD